jgi:hypothetical protein
MGDSERRDDARRRLALVLADERQRAHWGAAPATLQAEWLGYVAGGRTAPNRRYRAGVLARVLWRKPLTAKRPPRHVGREVLDALDIVDALGDLFF